jgi:hypothetical protein
MQTKVSVTLALGFIMGLGLASCASVENDRSVASEHTVVASDDHEKSECRVGESRNVDGNCEKAFDFDHPYHRGGR